MRFSTPSCGTSAVLFSWMLLFASPAPADPRSPFLGAVPVFRANEQRLKTPLALRLFPSPPGTTGELATQLAGWFSGARVEDQYLSVVVDNRRVPAAATPLLRAPTFLIDFGEPPVRTLVDEVLRDMGPTPGVEQLTRFVSGYITTKDLQRGYDTASEVAQRRRGDCTEHAVLLTALLRATGHAARVVHGLVIDAAVDGSIAMGHAWVEVAADSYWQTVDAVYPSPGPSLIYLPLRMVRDESSAFMMDLLAMPGIARIEIEAVTAHPAGSHE